MEKNGCSQEKRRLETAARLETCLALLSVVVIGVLHTARMDLLVVKNYGDKIQAHYLALAFFHPWVDGYLALSISQGEGVFSAGLVSISQPMQLV